MAEEQAQEKTEQATPRKLKQARDKGQIARSRELTTALVLLVGSAAMLSYGGTMVNGFHQLVTGLLSPNRRVIMDGQSMIDRFFAAVLESLLHLAPLFLLLAIVAILAPSFLGGWSFSVQALAPKWSKLDPIKGVSRLFSARSVVELVKALLKFILVLVTGIAVIYWQLPEILRLGAEPVASGLGHASRIIALSFLLVSSCLLLIAAVDVPFQIWEHARQMKMTKQEVKDDHKETDGDPHVKSRIRNVQREMAQRRMMAEVPKADVIVTNPDHYAVAIAYRPDSMRTPIVVAKGADHLAFRIQEIAVHHRVTRVEAPPLARALFYSTELNREIPAALFMAVAQVLAHVFNIRSRGGASGSKIITMDDLPVPEEMAQARPARKSSSAEEH